MVLAQDAMLVLMVFLISLWNLSSNIDLYLQYFISITVVLLLNISVDCLSYVYY